MSVFTIITCCFMWFCLFSIQLIRGEPITDSMFHISPAEGALPPKVNRNEFVHDFHEPIPESECGNRRQVSLTFIIKYYHKKVSQHTKTTAFTDIQ